MANKILSYVWEHSKQKGSALLMLVAMADQSNDHGVCFPATDTLAKKCRVTRRQAQRLVDQLEASGELIIYNRYDPEHPEHFYSNIYVVVVPGIEPALPEIKGECRKRQRVYSDTGVTIARSQRGDMTTRSSDASDTTIVTPVTLHSDAHVTEIVTPVTPEPLLDPHIPQKAVAPKNSANASGEFNKREPDPIFDAVALHIFEINDTNAEGGRIAKIANWLKGSYDGRGKQKVGKISAPAEVKHIEAFAQHCKTQGITPPYDFVRFVENWRKWASKPVLRVVQPPPAVPAPVHLTDDEKQQRREMREAAQADLLGAG